MCGVGHRQPSDEEQLVDRDSREGTGQDGQPVSPIHRMISSLKGSHDPEQGSGDQYACDIQSEWFDPKGCRLLGNTEVYSEYDIGRENGAVCEPGSFQSL